MMRYVMLIAFSAAIAVFVFQISIRAIYQPENLKRLVLGLHNKVSMKYRQADKKKSSETSTTGKNRMEDDIELLMGQKGHLRIFGIKIRSMGDFYILRIVLSVSLLLSFVLPGFLLNRNFYFYSVAAAIVFYFLSKEMLKGKIQSISRSILKELPDVIDLMASLVSAGLSLDESIYYISRNLKSSTGRLFDFYRIKILEGKSRAEAFDIIGRLSFCTEFKSFIKVLHQSEIIGNPVKDILTGLSRVYRNNQRDLLKMRAERMESNLIIVIFIFIFIPMLIIFLLPAIPQLRLLLA